MRRISRAISAGGYILVLAVLVIDAGLVSASLRAIAHATAEVDHARHVIAALESALSSLKDAETGQRGYLLTGREDYLLPFQTAESVLDETLSRLRSLTADNRAQQARAEELTRIAGAKMAELRATITLRREQGLGPALELVLTDRGKAAMDKARQVVDEFRAEESRLLDARKAQSQAAVRRTVITFGVTTGTALLLLGGVSILRQREAVAAAAIRKSEAWLSTTLTSIGDAVIATDGEGRVRFLNPIAEALTGWMQAVAVGRPMRDVFSIINEYTRAAAESPLEQVLRDGIIVGLANHTVLLGRSGAETPIEDSAAPIKDDAGRVIGVVLVFRDVAERRRQEQADAEQKRLAEFGRDVGFALTESTSLREMLDRSAALSVRHLDAAFARIWTLNEAGDMLELQAGSGLYTHVDGSHARVPVGQYKIGLIAQERKPHLTNSVIGDPRVPAQDWAARELVAFAGYPLIVDDRLVGVWALFSRQPLSRTTLQAMESVANGIALGIERKSAEEALARSEAWLATTLASIGDAVIATDGEGRVRFMNPVAERLTGWTLTEALRRPIAAVFQIINEETRRPAEHPVGRVLREGLVVGLANHTVLVARDGSERPIEDSAAPIRDGEARVAGVVMVFRDVTDERTAQRSIRESEARKAAILQTALDAIITIDHQGRVVEFNPAAEHIFGFPREDVIDREMCALIIPPAHREAHRLGLAHFQATGEGPILGKRIEITASRADGSEFPVELAVTRIPGDGPPLFTAHVRDISERRRAEQRLRFLAEAGVSLAGSLDYKETLKNIAHLAVSGFADFCFFDLAVEEGDRIERVAWAHADPRQQEAINRIREFVPPRQNAEHPVVRTITTGRTEYVPSVDDEWLKRTTLDAAHRAYLKRLGLSSLLCVPVPAGDGVIGALTFCLADAPRHFDEADARLAEDLGRRAGVSLQNALLYREAEEANRSKSQFLAVLSHELRTPLNPILLAVTSMLEQPSPIEELRPNLEMIRQYVNLQARLIDDLLDVMRIVRGKMPLHWEVADVHALIQRAIDVCRSEVLGKELRLQFALDAPQSYLNADPARLQQVFWNLIKNAVKFTPARGTITIRTRNETDRDDRGLRLIIEVADTGIGIEPDILPVVFDPFQQGESTITRKFGGLGLGLAICKGIVEGHGGLLTTGSAGHGQGTTFTIELRALPDPRAEVLSPPADSEPAAETPAPAARQILLVEDEPATLRLMVRLLRGLGHQVAAAGTIAAALDAEQTSDFNLIISDIGLPDGSGLELMRRIVARRGPVAAIALTGYGMEEDIQRSRAAGFTAHMTKPIDFSKLEAMIRKISL